MKRIALFAALMFALAPFLAAQEKGDHFNVGAFADYVRLHSANNLNFWGLGGRVGAGVHNHAMLEAEMGYEFEQETVTSSATTFTRTGLRELHGLFGPMLYAGSDHFRAFLAAKGGFVNFSVSNKGPISGFTGAVSSVTSGNTNGAFYPGGGIEAFAGPIGLRVDVGDLMYFDNGAHHNLRVSFGPFFRF